MRKCDYCGTTILFGGRERGHLRFCNDRCAAQGDFVAASRQVPVSIVQQHVLAVHQGACPQCKGPGPVDVHTGYRVWSALVLTQWSSHPRVSCRSCGNKGRMGDLALSLLLGWWGFPWGFIMTPVQIGRNLAAMAAGDGNGPSPQLEALVRTMLAQQAFQASGSPNRDRPTR